ncbi:MAG: hypothetical protein NT068_01200 [Candidatus Nomurabacteria bacterium]|nr:hypothetical protein [Candidatus Nomurabacteria bacterium]
MKKRLLSIAIVATVILLFLGKITSAQTDSMHCGNYNPQNMEVTLPYYNDTVIVYVLYDKRGKFTYTDQDFKDGKYVTYQKIANKNFKKLKSHDDVVIPVSFENLEIFQEVFYKYKKEDLRFKNVKIDCSIIFGSPGQWITTISIYLEKN